MADPTNSAHIKDPDANKDYAWDWAAFLGVDTIASAQVLASVPAGLTIANVSNTATNVTAWISGGSLGVVYTVTCRVVTTGGRTDDWSKTIHVLSR